MEYRAFVAFGFPTKVQVPQAKICPQLVSKRIIPAKYAAKFGSGEVGLGRSVGHPIVHVTAWGEYVFNAAALGWGECANGRLGWR